MWCGVLRVCVCGVLCWCWCSCLVVVLCGVVWCGVVWCVFLCFFVLFFSCFSQCFSFSFLLSLSFSLSFFLLSSLPLFLLSSLLATKHYGKNRSTNTAANIEAFECDLAQGKCTAVGSLPPPLPSLLPSPPLLFKKKEETFYYRNISGEGIILHYSFKLIQKNRRRVKLQSLQFFILIRKQSNCNASNL